MSVPRQPSGSASPEAGGAAAAGSRKVVRFFSVEGQRRRLEFANLPPARAMTSEEEKTFLAELKEKQEKEASERDAQERSAAAAKAAKSKQNRGNEGANDDDRSGRSGGRAGNRSDRGAAHRSPGGGRAAGSGPDGTEPNRPRGRMASRREEINDVDEATDDRRTSGRPAASASAPGREKSGERIDRVAGRTTGSRVPARPGAVSRRGVIGAGAPEAE
jgi:hypothetical protein